MARRRLRHDWRCVGGSGDWEVYECRRCHYWAIPSPFGFMWADLLRLVHRGFGCDAPVSIT